VDPYAEARRRKTGDQARDGFAELRAEGTGGSWEKQKRALWPARLAVAAEWPDDEITAELVATAEAIGRGREAGRWAQKTLAEARRRGPADLAGLTREERAAIAAGGAPPPPRRRARTAPRPEPPPDPVKRPELVVELLRRCVPPAEDPEARAWLKSRSIPAGLPLPFHVLPHDLDGIPGWARRLRDRGYRALFPLWDHQGYVRSVVARPLGKGKPLAVAGFDRRLLVLANDAAVRVLRGAAPVEPVAFVVEGEPDWLTFTAAFPTLPVLGVGSGAWKPSGKPGSAFAERFPTGMSWWIGTDDNEAGDRYASDVAATLYRPAEVWRARVRRLAEARGAQLDEKCPDWNDALQAGVFTADHDSMIDALNDSAMPFAEDPEHG